MIDVDTQSRRQFRPSWIMINLTLMCHLCLEYSHRNSSFIMFSWDVILSPDWAALDHDQMIQPVVSLWSGIWNYPCHNQVTWSAMTAQHLNRSPVNSPLKGQWHGALMFSSICAWINTLLNNLRAGDLRCHHAHYDIIVMRNKSHGQAPLPWHHIALPWWPHI